MSHTVADAPLQSRLRVDAVAAPHAARRRLAEVGIRPGARVVVTSATAGGGRVVAVSEARIAVDKATAAGIAVSRDEEAA